MLRRLLLPPLLAPLVAALVVAALNPRPSLSLRLLSWRSPALPGGAWIALAAGGGALLSAGATGLALREGGGGTPLRRRVREERGERGERRFEAEPWAEEGAWARGAGWSEPAARQAAPNPFAGVPPRAPGEPAPTVEVPFRVIRRGASTGAAAAAEASAAAHRREAPGRHAEPRGRRPEAVEQPVPMPVDDWGGEQADDW